LDLELAIMLESYHEDLALRVRRVERLEREHLERALAQSEHRYASAVELARVLVVGLDASGRIGLFNREAERATGHARDQALGQRFDELLLPEELHDEGARVLLAAQNGEALGDGWEAPLRTRSGRLKTVRWQLAPVREPHDVDVALFAIGQDVS